VRLPDGVRRLLRLDDPPARVRRDVADEIDFHFAEAVEAYRRRGLSEPEALRLARERFGDERAYRYALERIDHGRVRMRDRRERTEAVTRTIGYALRGVRRNPGFTISIVAILALGIGANAVMFGVVDRLLLSPPQHVVEADAVRLLYIRREIFNGEIDTERTITYPDYRDFASVGAFSSVAAYNGPYERTVGRGDAARQARISGATASLFPLLGVTPAFGRFFLDSDEEADATPTAVLAHEYWEREYGASTDVLGSTIDIGDGTYEIVGVAPPGFTGAQLAPVDIWAPATVLQTIEAGDRRWETNRGWYWIQGVARLAPEATVEAAEAEATAMHRAGRAEQIAEDRYDEDAAVLVAPIIAARGPSPTEEAQVTRWLAGVSLIVLLIACFNAANLLLARAIRSQREVAVRLALGVSRSRLVGELVSESLILAGLGAAAGLLLAYGLDGTVHDLLLPNVAFTDAALGRRLLVFTVAAAIGAGLLAGVLPALQSSRAHVADALKAGGRDIAGGRSRTRVALLVGQAALSVVLLVGAGLFVRSLRSASGLDLGFDARNVAVLGLEWNETLPMEERQSIYERVLDGVRRLPGVHAAGLTYTVPFWSSISLGQPRVPGLDSIPRHHDGGPYVNKVGSGYFDAMGLSILQGRAFEPADDSPDAPPVVIVSESMARAVWPAGDAIGSCMMVGDDDEDPPCAEVVGVVENHHRQDLVEDDPHFLYFVNQSHPGFQGPPQALMVGTTAEARTVMPLLRAEAAGTSSQIRFVTGVPLQTRIDPQLRSWRLGASMFTAFGILALIVAAWGLYSVLAFDVALRQHEIGIRSALGAGVPRLVRMVMERALVLVVTGTAVGLLVSWAGSRFIAPLLFGVSPTDLLVYATVAVTLVAIAALAGSIPAIRASRVDPREALQTE